MSAAHPYRLYDFPASPFCIKVRSILDYKRIAFERVDASNLAVMRRLRHQGGIGKVPALEMGDRLICDSTDIAYALERIHPDPPILPVEPRDRALCHVIEDWADESLYWHGVHYRWIDPAGRAGAGAIFPSGFVSQKVLPAIIAHTARKQLAGQGTGRKPTEHIARDLARQLDYLVMLLDDRDFLLGPSPMLCDFAVCGQLVYLSRTPRGAAELGSRLTLEAFLDRMRALRASARDSADQVEPPTPDAGGDD